MFWYKGTRSTNDYFAFIPISLSIWINLMILILVFGCTRHVRLLWLFIFVSILGNNENGNEKRNKLTIISLK